MNVDAGCFSNETGWGLIGRDNCGISFSSRNHGSAMVLCCGLSRTRREDVVVSPLVAETMGLRWCFVAGGAEKLQESHCRDGC
jgi:hypothetical protein